MNNVVIVSATRTAVGKFGGSLKDFSPGQLGSVVLKDALKRVNVEQSAVDEVVMGNVLSAGHGQNVARQAAIGAGIPKEVPSYCVNKVCGSGLKSVVLGAQSIMLGDADVILAVCREFILLFPCNIVFFCYVLCCNSHVVISENIP